MEVCSAGSRESGGTGREAHGAGGRRARAEGGRPRGQRRGCGASLPRPSVRSPPAPSSARPALQEREPRTMSGFVFLRARGSLRMLVIFPPQLGEKTRQRQCGRRARGGGGGGGGGDETEPGERLGRAGGRRSGERRGRLASVCGSSGASAMEAEPRRGCCTDPPPTPRSGPAHLAVSRLSIGPSRRDASGGRTNGRRRPDGGAEPLFFFFFFFLFSFFLSDKMGRRGGGERPASGDVAAGLDRALRDPAGRWAGLRAGRVFVRGGRRGRRGQVPGAGGAAQGCCPGYHRGHSLPFQPLRARVHIPGEHGAGSNNSLRT